MAWWRSEEAERNKENDDKLIEDQNTKWEQDRAAFSGEWSGLVSEWGGEYEGPAILEKDGFPSMTHQQIYDALEGVNAGLIDDLATTWRNLATEARSANKEFLDGVNADLEAGWNGQSGTAAVEGVRAFSTSFTSLAAGFQMVAHNLDLVETHLGQAKASVGKPDNVTAGDQIVNFLLPDDVFKTPQYRADEAQETARNVMLTYYEPGVSSVDSQTPILPEPVKPVDDGSKPQGTDLPNGNNTTNGNDNGTDTQPPGQQQPTGEDPQSTEPQSTEPQATVPQSTTPQATTPQSTTPTSPALTTGTPTTPGAPGLPSGTPAGAPQTTTPGLRGQTLPGGTPNKPAGTPATTAASTANRAGRTGMPGMMSPAARGANRGEDDEHETPDYLVYDRGSELLGTQPPALPPGGVIGA